jgi:hypothetical protein
MPLKKIKKGLEASLNKEKGKCPSTIIGGIFHNFRIKRIESRIKNIETELSNRKTKR